MEGTRVKNRAVLFFLIPFSLFILSGCGFTPLYGDHAGAGYGNEDLLEYVYIENIPNRDGQFLRNELIDLFYRSGRPENPVYKLEVSKLASRRIALDLTETADTTREQLRLRADMRLVDKLTGETVLERDLLSIAASNVLDSEYATRISRLNANDNAIRDLARQIQTQLVLYFERSAKGL